MYIPQGGGVDILHLFSPNRHVPLNRVGFMGVLCLKQVIKFHHILNILNRVSFIKFEL